MYTYSLWRSVTFLRHICNLQLLGRTINLRSLIAERMNKLFRENLEFLFDRFESQDLCAIVVSNSNSISLHVLYYLGLAMSSPKYNGYLYLILI